MSESAQSKSQTPSTWQSAQHCFINRDKEHLASFVLALTVERDCCEYYFIIIILFNLWGVHPGAMIMKA